MLEKSQSGNINGTVRYGTAPSMVAFKFVQLKDEALNEKLNTSFFENFQIFSPETKTTTPSDSSFTTVPYVVRVYFNLCISQNGRTRLWKAEDRHFCKMTLYMSRHTTRAAFRPGLACTVIVTDCNTLGGEKTSYEK